MKNCFKESSILRQIVGRVNVQCSIDVALRFAINRLKDKQKTFDELSKANQENFIKLVKKYHRENQKLFVAVMRGF